MANILFVTTEDIKQLSPIGGNVDSDKYLESIDFVQVSELTPILGVDLMNEITTQIENIDTTPITPEIQTLLDNHIKKFLVNFAAGDYLLTNNYTVANGGTSTYQPDNGFPVSAVDNVIFTNKLERKAKLYGQNMITFLQENVADYPKWNGSTTNSNFWNWEFGPGEDSCGCDSFDW